MKTLSRYLLLAMGLIVLCASCVSLQDKEMTANDRVQMQVLGQVEAEFDSWQILHIINAKGIKRRASVELMRKARQQYEGNIEIKNITITGGWSGWELLNILVNGAFGVTGLCFLYDFVVGPSLLAVGVAAGNTQRITATGDVVLVGGGAGTPLANRGGIDGALNKAVATLIESMPANATIAILNVSSADRDTSEYVIDTLEYRFVSAKLNIVDRQRLEQIRSEQNFQLSGEVSDSSAVTIGNLLGASIVITGNISGSGASRRLTLRALDVSTARIVTMAMELF